MLQMVEPLVYKFEIIYLPCILENLKWKMVNELVQIILRK